MTGVGHVYGAALYALAREEDLQQTILQQLEILDSCFTLDPAFTALLGVPNLSKAERCQILDDCFHDKLEPYVLNFLKILTEKGCIRHFSSCATVYRALYNRDNGILAVTAVTAVAMTHGQTEALTEKLRQLTGRRIDLTNRLDPSVLGGIRLDLNGKRVDDTISRRLEQVGNMLKSTVL